MTRARDLVALAVLVALLGGCAATQQMTSVEKSGFMHKYYSLLRPGEDGEARLVYMNPKTNWAAYDKVILSPVTVWLGPDSKLNELTPEVRNRLANELWARINAALKDDYEMVQFPDRGVMRIHAAITDAEESDAGLDTISSIVPQFRLLTGAKGMMAGGQPGFVGAASVEVKIRDSKTGALLAAAVDRRAGTKNLSGVTNSWNDVEQAYQYWADRLKYRLCQERGGTNCVEAEE